MSARRASWLDLSLLALVNLFWAAQYPAYKVASDHLGVATLNFWTFVFATLCLLPFLLRERRKKNSSRPWLRQSGDLWRFVALSAAGILPPSVFLAWGIAHSTAANGSILSMTIPIPMTLMGVVFLKEKLSPLRVAGLLLGVAGTLLISSDDLKHASFAPRLLAGNMVIFLAGLGAAFYNAYGKDLLHRYTELELLVYSDAIALLFCGAISIFFERDSLVSILQYTPTTWLSLLVLGLLSWGVAMVLWMRVLANLDLVQVSVSVYLLPVFGVALSLLMLHEHIGLGQVAGGVLVIVGTVALTIFDNQRAATPSTAETVSLS